MAMIVAVLAASAGAAVNAQQPAGAQPCNPVIDGTYCATQGGRAFGGSSASVNMGSIHSLSNDLSLGQDSPATFAGISFSGNTTCLGLLRRAGCN